MTTLHTFNKNKIYFKSLFKKTGILQNHRILCKKKNGISIYMLFVYQQDSTPAEKTYPSSVYQHGPTPAEKTLTPKPPSSATSFSA